MKISIRAKNIFSSGYVIFDFTGDDIDEMNADLLAKITNLRKTDKGDYKTNSSRVDSWHSTERLEEMEEFARFKAFANEQLFHAGNYFGFVKNPIVTCLWAIALPKFGENYPHIHPNTHLVGTYYLQAPKNSGKLVFLDPRAAALASQPSFRNDEQGQIFDWGNNDVAPIVGRMVIAPNWMMHYVEANMSDEERIVLAFNAAHSRSRT